MKRAILISVAVLVLFSTTGCGFVGSIVLGGKPFIETHTNFGPFSGVRLDIEAIAREEWPTNVGQAFLLLDIPISLAFDIIFLPVSFIAWAARGFED